MRLWYKIILGEEVAVLDISGFRKTPAEISPVHTFP